MFLYRLFSGCLAAALLMLSSAPAAGSAAFPLAQTQPARPAIYEITTNLDTFPGGQVPRYEKLEITFQVDTSAANLQLPFDANPPAGIQPGAGISVDALFSPDHWQTVYTQPAFFYQGFFDEVKNGREWFYPSGKDTWKVRFAPNRTGGWQYKLRAQDRGGVIETPEASFYVANSSHKGPIRVSANDPRYFEYQDGTYFPALGYNMNFDDVSWTNPVLDNEENFRIMAENGIQLVRIWLSQWAVYGSAWNPWHSINPELHAQVVPYSGLTFERSYSNSDVSMKIDAAENPCMFLGFLQSPAAVKTNTRYKVRVRYLLEGIQGPRIPGKPYGFAAKSGGWLWGEDNNCDAPGSGTRLTPYQAQNTSGWQVLEGEIETGQSNFLPYFYLALENTSRGTAYIDRVWIQEDLGDGKLGPNILPRPWMAYHQYMDQRNSYAFDKVVQLAEQYGITLRPVVLEKNEYISNHINFAGRPIADDPRCRDEDSANDPTACPGNQWFYGNWREETKTRWLQQAYWRYLQGRWGYSSSIHSWELLNEGDPFNSAHYTLAESFARYMQQFAPNDHLVSTSFWHSFPLDEFWANPEYASVDFADIHQYIAQDDPFFADTALATVSLSLQIGAKQPGGAGKPVIRGETGLVQGGSGPPAEQATADAQGDWLHDLIWGGINPGGMIESYWYADDHIYHKINESYLFDHRPLFRPYYNFIRNIPLANGNYQDAAAASSNPALRVWGQKDLVNGRAHLWIQNAGHTWLAVANGGAIPPLSGMIRINGFQPAALYTLQWWDTSQPDAARQVLRSETLRATAEGTLVVQIQGLAGDLALHVLPRAGKPQLSPRHPQRGFWFK